MDATSPSAILFVGAGRMGDFLRFVKSNFGGFVPPNKVRAQTFILVDLPAIENLSPAHLTTLKNSQ